MFEVTLTPRFYETDAFGHVNNTVITCWFETAREPVFRLFDPDLDPATLPLILARVEVDFVGQIYYGHPVTLQTGIERVGNSSFVVIQQAWQQERMVARGKAVQVYFDHHSQASAPLPDAYRARLEELVGSLPAALSSC